MNLLLLLAATQALSCPAQAQALDGAAREIEAHYLDVDQGRRIAADVRRWAADGRYVRHCDAPDAFLAAVNRDLDAYDPHFLLERADQATNNDWLTAWRAGAREANAGVRDVRVLEGNIGYLRLSSFYPWSDARPKLRSAFELLADADGLILDLRQNGGGESEGAKQIVAALLGPKGGMVQHIERRGRRSADPLPEPELPLVAAGRPVAVLVDRRSASASEYVAYSLQVAGRAKVIGSRSGGVAHLLGDSRPVGAGYALFVPEARPVNLATGGNWEGQGVAPDLAGGDDPLFRARVWMADAVRAP